MFLGEYEHTIGDKPAHAAGSLPRRAPQPASCSPAGSTRCLDVYPRSDWDALVEAQLATLDPFSREARDLRRFFFGARPTPSSTSRAACSCRPR